MRDALSDVLVKIAKQDSTVILLTGDHGYALFDDFRKECPDQYINAGIAEQNMVGIAAGLARCGFRPIVYGLSAFVPVRVLEQIKLDVAHDDLPVIFLGDGAGFVYSHLGTSHQSVEDIACTRSIPHLSVYSPADRFEITRCMHMAYEQNSPVYVRIGKSDCGDIHTEVPQYNVGDLLKVRPGKSRKCTFIATGSMVSTAINVARQSYPDLNVWSVPVIKPVNELQVGEICKASDAVVVFEEHSKYGGLGSLIAELAAEISPVRILRIAVEDCFSEKCGTYQYLLKEHGLDSDTVLNRIQGFLDKT
jgi:transketolase